MRGNETSDSQKAEWVMTEKPIATLNDVLLKLSVVPAEHDRSISSLALDSRNVVDGSLFLAVSGIASDGRDYMAQACQQGATAIIAESGREDELSAILADINIPVIFVSGLKKKVGFLASRYYRPFSEKIKVVGVTGTNGKTSCCWFLSQLLSAMGEPCAIMGTLGKGMPDALETMLNTTPDVISTHQFIAGLDAKSCSNLAMEVSSHGLEQGRVDGVQFEVGVFTNLSRDHLDSYGSMDEYAAAKSLLFSHQSLKYAVINKDDPYAAMMLAACPAGLNITTWSQLDPSADVYASDIRLLAEGFTATVHSPWGVYPVAAALMGRFNLENLLTVITTLGVQGYSLERIMPLLSNLTTVPGRMQRLGGGSKPLVLVDYAHTPDALSSALGTLREHGAEKLICVFGCGGDRDKGKRPLMTEAALSGADSVILTSDNPRTEVPEAIIADALEVEGADKSRIKTIVNRSEAITEAIANADVDDIVVIAGKGHETYQEIHGVRYPFDDCEHVRNALENWGES